MQEMPMPLISVIIPVYNCVEYLPKALGSVLDQNGVTVEVILVDSSTDNSCAISSRLSEPRVRHVYQELFGKPFVVCVLECNVITLRMLDTKVSCRRDTARLLVDMTHSWLTLP